MAMAAAGGVRAAAAPSAARSSMAAAAVLVASALLVLPATAMTTKRSSTGASEASSLASARAQAAAAWLERASGAGAGAGGGAAGGAVGSGDEVRFVDESTTEATYAFEAPLDEEGYLAVAKLESDREMEVYMRRVIGALGLEVANEGSLRGVVPFFSGEKTMQTLFDMQQQLLAAATTERSWLRQAAAEASQPLPAGGVSGDSAPLNEVGCGALLRQRGGGDGGDADLVAFLRRVVSRLGLAVADEGGLAAFARDFAAGRRGATSFASLRLGVFGTVRSTDAWATSGQTAVLSEAGYGQVVALRSDAEMARFLRRVARQQGCAVTDEGGVSGTVPFFSGRAGRQSLAAMQRDVRKACGLLVGEEAAEAAGARPHYGSLHDVVGNSGVLQIQLESSRRVAHSRSELHVAGIVPTVLPATNAGLADPEELRRSCPLAAEAETREVCERRGRELGGVAVGGGCVSTIEQAITDSHRRALLAAAARDEEWTAIIEDDVVPVSPGAFDAEFRKAWARLPEEAKIVRLGWCTFEGDLGAIRKKTLADVGHFRLVSTMTWADGGARRHYYTGGCSTGYIVHRSVLPELLGMFPCCCPIDCCLERQLFYTPTKPRSIPGRFRGEQIMINMDAWESREVSFNYTTFPQGGVLIQDNRNTHSERPEFNATQ